MQNFKTFLSESKQKNFAPWQDPSSPEFVDVDVYDYYNGTCRKNRDGSYSSNANDAFKISCLKLNSGKKRVIPVKFSTLANFDMIASKGTGLTTLQGAPDKVKYQMSIDSLDLTTLDYLYTEVGGDLYINCPALETIGNANVKVNNLTLQDIGKASVSELPHTFEINETLFFTPQVCYRRPILSLLKIKGNFSNIIALHALSNQNDPNMEQYKELNEVCKILSKYIKSKNILACANELRIAKLYEYAKL
jgi:hypothetical protein